MALATRIAVIEVVTVTPEPSSSADVSLDDLVDFFGGPVKFAGCGQ